MWANFERARIYRSRSEVGSKLESNRVEFIQSSIIVMQNKANVYFNNAKEALNSARVGRNITMEALDKANVFIYSAMQIPNSANVARDLENIFIRIERDNEGEFFLICDAIFSGELDY